MDITITLLMTLSLESYLLGVVPAEIYAVWPSESIKAQAVLARTYAMYHVAHPRGREFNLYANERSQVYDPSKRRPETDSAVQSTNGIYIVAATGSIPLIEYVSKCGRNDCPYCCGQPGHKTKNNPDGVWPGRVCQYGMRAMALRDSDYQSIIRHFVGFDIQFKDMKEEVKSE